MTDDNRDPVAAALACRPLIQLPPDTPIDEDACHFWARMPKWTAEEFLTLAVGRDPRMVSAQTIADNPDHYSVADDLELIDAIGSRDGSAFLLSTGRAPNWWIEWTDQHELPFHQPLREAVAKKAKRDAEREAAASTQCEKQPASREGETIGTRQRESLLKLIIGMAVGGYGYDPRSLRSPIPAQIATDLEIRGLSLSDDTIRKYLREGADLLPPPQDE